METQKIQIGASLRQAWEIFKREWMVLVGFLVLSLAINVAIGSGGLQTHVLPHGAGITTTGSPLISLIGWFFGIFLGITGIAISLMVVRAQEISMEAIKAYFTIRTVVSYVVSSLLIALFVMVGLFFFIIPGIYLMLKYMFVTYIVIDKKMGPIDAMKESGRITYGHKWKLLGLIGVLLLINLVGLMALGVGILISAPLSMVLAAVIYVQLEEGNRLTKEGDEEDIIEVESVEDGDTSKSKK